MTDGIAYRIKRWMYRGGRPNLLARILNRLSAAVHSSGAMPEHWVTLEVPGRKSGRPTSLPLVVADHEGARYLVSMLGEDVNWVRNVRAAGGRVVLRHGIREEVWLREVEPGARAPILRRHLAVAPGARPHVPVHWKAPLEEFAKIADRFPVFEIVPDHGGSRAGNAGAAASVDG